ncbi:uncharacterized protein LOC127831343 [Dreissena polymorpha]|uniref:uncharacterized protein LOC127831343 n=1 Tax=Dreissena polymorpha TaxID=45954 RepID=UPI0022645574|nr:uncharacterized protein LOC127831343 [Dreissena polymorpha]
MPPDGYIGVCSIEDTDFNGIARDISKKVRHSSDLKVTSTDLQDYFRTLVTLLSDSRVLLHDSGAQDAVRKLNQLENDPLNISESDACQLLKDILRKAEQASEETKTQLQTVVNGLQQELTEVEHVFEETKTQLQTHSEHIEILYSRQDVYEKAIEHNQIDSRHNREETNYDQSVQDFREQLIKHYQEKYGKVAVSPLMPKNFRSLEETYVAPKIRRIVTESDGSRKKKHQVSTYKDFLHTDKDSKKRIFLQDTSKTNMMPLSQDALCDLHNLESIKIDYNCNGLELNECSRLKKSLRNLKLCNSVTLVPHSLRDLRELEQLELFCKYDGLDLSSCKMLRILNLCNTVSLVPNTLHNLQTLEYLQLSCTYEDLDLAIYWALSPLPETIAYFFCSLPGAIYWALCPLSGTIAYNFCSLPEAIYWALCPLSGTIA